MEFGVWGLGFGVSGLGVGVRASGFGFRVKSFGFRVYVVGGDSDVVEGDEVRLADWRDRVVERADLAPSLGLCYQLSTYHGISKVLIMDLSAISALR